MKPITIFKPKMFLQRDLWLTLSFAGKLVVQEGLEKSEAVLMACNYYQQDDVEQVTQLLDKFIDENAYTVVQIPNKLKGEEVVRYVKDKFG